MGKRNTIVVSSDDDGDKMCSLSSKSEYCKPKLKREYNSSSTPLSNPKRAKRSHILNTGSRSFTDHDGFEEMNLFSEDFNEGFYGFKVPAGSKRISKELWVDKYKPRLLEDLAVHKNKVKEVKLWFEERLRNIEGNMCNNVLLVTGQAGVGKSASIHVIASHLGATVWEWNTPTPTLWQEHLHTSMSGIRYTSKLDEFENFVVNIRKYGLFPPSFTGESKKSTIILIDDLPLVNGKTGYNRLHKCLNLLVQSARIPTAIIFTDYDNADSADYSTSRSFEKLQSSLQSAGMCKVCFNPITNNSIKKTLTRICKEEKFEVNLEQIELIAKASGGDIRHAITSLQYFCLKPQSVREGSRGCIKDGSSLGFGRDETLSLFHALGKFLHNKREIEPTISSSYKNEIMLKDRFTRLPLKMDEAEKILCQAHGQARPIAEFLHENVLDFMNEEAIDDAWIVSSYLSDADCLLASFGGFINQNFEAENIVQSAAASVAARGVLFGNSQPLSSRWHAIRRPKLWRVDKSLSHNKFEIAKERLNIVYNNLYLSEPSIIATEFKPMLKLIGFRAYEETEVCKIELEDEENTSDDIEDW